MSSPPVMSRRPVEYPLTQIIKENPHVGLRLFVPVPPVMNDFRSDRRADVRPADVEIFC